MKEWTKLSIQVISLEALTDSIVANAFSGAGCGGGCGGCNWNQSTPGCNVFMGMW